MNLNNIRLGLCMTGSFCTYANVFTEIEKIVKTGMSVTTIFSNSAQTISSRFGTPEEFAEKIINITGNKPITSISDVEPLEPNNKLDIILVAPCTGNTLAKLANGITDSPVLMAVKGHLRNNKPVVLSISTNDALSANLKNIGILINTKNIYFVPFGQDNPEKKPNSMVAINNLILPAIEHALAGKQYQPVLQSPHL